MFVCFEGIDGAGKSTQARMLLERLQAEGTATELVADPGTTHIGAAIRKILLENDAPISPAAQMLLFSAARAELAEYIKAKLSQNVVIICDRWLLSTLVYQGDINKLPLDLIVDILEKLPVSAPTSAFCLTFRLLPPVSVSASPATATKNAVRPTGNACVTRTGPTHCIAHTRRSCTKYKPISLPVKHTKRFTVCSVVQARITVMQHSMKGFN